MSPGHPLVERLAARLAAGPSGPVSQLIVDDIWLAVIEGRLGTAERLPTPRQVAIALEVSPRSVETAYAELERRGVVVSRPGEGTFVTLAASDDAEHERYRQFHQLCRETVARARELGFEVDQLLDNLTEYRTAQREP